MHRIIFFFFFLSGFSSLVFEVLWARMLMRVFGTTSFTISTLLTAFMAGLALGSAIGGRIAHRVKRPLLLYGIMEGAIGLYALLVPVLLGFLPVLYSFFFDHFIENFYTFSLLRFVAVFAILIVPTTLMGATLPLISHWISNYTTRVPGSIGILYGTNTLGACAGCFLAGFVLLPSLGLASTNLVFALVNFALAIVVAITSHRWQVLNRWQGADTEDSLDEQRELENLLGASHKVSPLPTWFVHLLFICFALTGALSMSYQVLWTRAYVIILGSSTYSFTLVLTAILIGIAAGSAVISLFVHRIQRPVLWLALAQFGVAIAATASFFLVDKLPGLLFYRMRETINSAADIYLYYFFLIGLLVLIPSFLQGLSFTLVVRSLVLKTTGVGAKVGKLYTFNSTGAILGSFTAGFVLMPLLGLYKAMLLLVVLNILIASILSVAELSQRRSPRQMTVVAVFAIVSVSLLVIAPPMNQARLTSGMFRSFLARELFTPQRFERTNPKILYYKDGLSATITVEQRGNSRTLKANGKPEASDGADMATQILVGLLPFVVRSGNSAVAIGQEDSLMIGYGSGVTAGASLQWPLKGLEVVEIEGAMVEASRFFDHVNHRPLEDTRTHFIESDGRNYLEYVGRSYDVIVSEPSNPWIAGVSSLFTVEHFKQVQARLNPGGVFAQWVQLYELSPQNVQRIFATVLEVFPYVHAFSSMPRSTDLILIASNDPIPLPASGYKRAWEYPAVQKELARAGIDHIHDLYGLMFMSYDELQKFSHGAELNTDDNGILEFEAPRDLIMYWVGERYFAEKYFRSGIYGDPRPYLENWPKLDSWSAENIGTLARAQWLAGKSPLAHALLQDTHFARWENVPRPEYGSLSALEEIHRVLHAESILLGEALTQAWPVADSALHPLIVQTVTTNQHAQALIALERQQAPQSDGYSGERGLFYAYLLAERRYYRPALRQLERLRNEANPEITNSLPFLLLDGFVHQRRAQLKHAYQAYLKAGTLLIE